MSAATAAEHIPPFGPKRHGPRQPRISPSRLPARRRFDAELRALTLKAYLATVPSHHHCFQALLAHSVKPPEVSSPSGRSASPRRLADASADEPSPDDLRVTAEGFADALAALTDDEAIIGVLASALTEVPPADAFVTPTQYPLMSVYTVVALRVLKLRLRVQLEQASSIPSVVASVAAKTSEDDMAAAPLCGDRIDPAFAERSSPRLSHEDVEQFIADILPHLRLCRDCAPWLVPYYLCHCATKIVMTLDPQRVGSISVDALLTSTVLNELLMLYDADPDDAVLLFPVGTSVEVSQQFVDEVRSGGSAPPHAAMADADTPLIPAVVVGVDGAGTAPDSLYTLAVGDNEDTVQVPRECLYVPTTSDGFAASADVYDSLSRTDAPGHNWFALPIMLRVYLHFCSLDRDSDGLLDEAEMRAYNNASFTPLAIARVFQVHATGYGNNLIDFRRFVEFAVATEFPTTPAARKYFWALLDLHDTHSYISLNVLRVFCGDVARRLVDEGLMTVTADSILSEIVDMINPAEVDRVTLEDVERSGYARTVLPTMLDFRCFYNYDCREQQLAQAAARDTV